MFDPVTEVSVSYTMCPVTFQCRSSAEFVHVVNIAFSPRSYTPSALRTNLSVKKLYTPDEALMFPVATVSPVSRFAVSDPPVKFSVPNPGSGGSGGKSSKMFAAANAFAEAKAIARASVVPLCIFCPSRRVEHLPRLRIEDRVGFGMPVELRHER